MKAHLLFEQSGTFKRAFKKFGINAYDYDISDEFGETDYKIDLFDQIDRGSQGATSIFDEISTEDIVMAFFPCTRFQKYNSLWLSGRIHNIENYNTVDKLYVAKKIHRELSEMYERLSSLVQIAENRKLQLIIENPATQPNYLTTYWLPCTFVDKDRTVRGDNFKKPTQYWFFNREVRHNLVMHPQEQIDMKTVVGTQGKDRAIQRSIISDNYAENFLQEFVLDSQE